MRDERNIAKRLLRLLSHIQAILFHIPHSRTTEAGAKAAALATKAERARVRNAMVESSVTSTKQQAKSRDLFSSRWITPDLCE
jgi:hypothetical protein